MRIILSALVPALLASCVPPPVPPPRFTPNPPYAPQPVEPDEFIEEEPSPPDAPTEPAAPKPGEYPTATRTENPNEVVSPHPPYKTIDVSDLGPGQLARDPWNNKIFRIP
jgi:hypothetical protein